MGGGWGMDKLEIKIRRRNKNTDDQWEEEYPSLTTLATRHHKDDQSLISLVFSKEYKDASKAHTRETKVSIHSSLKLCYNAKPIYRL
ncbi:uncharacterized protein G2W53_041370 [Senna tora]|uniref:Uncharacterized protein n=1 Tax=Senna tora TaxID=362788 RepID=A0A834SRZ2_9FABA|nr:uncharacterized protein G2W53_041370 [Senna tora]